MGPPGSLGRITGNRPDHSTHLSHIMRRSVYAPEWSNLRSSVRTRRTLNLAGSHRSPPWRAASGQLPGPGPDCPAVVTQLGKPVSDRRMPRLLDGAFLPQNAKNVGIPQKSHESPWHSPDNGEPH
jgi:hypothetical protein